MCVYSRVSPNNTHEIHVRENRDARKGFSNNARCDFRCICRRRRCVGEYKKKHTHQQLPELSLSSAFRAYSSDFPDNVCVFDKHWPDPRHRVSDANRDQPPPLRRSISKLYIYISKNRRYTLCNRSGVMSTDANADESESHLHKHMNC